MSKFTINVTSFTAPAGKEYEAVNYPGQGFYYNPVTFQWFIVSRFDGCTVDSVMYLGKGSSPPFKTEAYVEPPSEVAHQGIQASDLLKAIAISQNPLLAKELLK